MNEKNKQKILKKAIEKAVKNGYKHAFSFTTSQKDGINSLFECLLGDDRKLNDEFMTIIFSHNFAKAFWGEGISLQQVLDHSRNPCSTGKCNVCVGSLGDWKFHLQQMVLSRDPIKYLGKFLLTSTKLSHHPPRATKRNS